MKFTVNQFYYACAIATMVLTGLGLLMIHLGSLQVKLWSIIPLAFSFFTAVMMLVSLFLMVAGLLSKEKVIQIGIKP